MTNSKNIWDNVASYYDAVWEVPDYGHILKVIDKETEVSSAGIILDVATGTGVVALDLAKRTVHKGEIIGLDASRLMLKKALEKTETSAVHNVQFVLGDAHNLPFRDNLFDAVTCSFCLPWFTHPEIAIREMTRVVKPTRKVVCVEYEKPPVEFWAELRRKAGIKDPDRSELITILSNSGLKKVQAEAISVLHRRPNVSNELVKKSERYTLTIIGLKEEDGDWYFQRIREEYGKLPPEKRHWLPFLYQGTK
jgi:ubiquinone/menaquinone biosynthesis C-methylase UbiE